MDYVIKISKVGTYGERTKVEWFAGHVNGELLASLEQLADGGVHVVLYAAAGGAFPRTVDEEMPSYSVCEAHVKERGYTNLKTEYADVRAYND